MFLSPQRYEENKLYVYLNKKYNCDMAHLEATHEEMHVGRDQVMALFDKAIELRDRITDVAGWSDPSVPALPPPPGSKKEEAPDPEKVAAVKEQVRKEFLVLKPELEKAIKDYDMLLRRHLKEEEEVVIPMVLELTPDEFEFYYDNRIDVILEEMGSGKSRRRSSGKKKKILPW